MGKPYRRTDLFNYLTGFVKPSGWTSPVDECRRVIEFMSFHRHLPFAWCNSNVSPLIPERDRHGIPELTQTRRYKTLGHRHRRPRLHCICPLLGHRCSDLLFNINERVRFGSAAYVYALLNLAPSGPGRTHRRGGETGAIMMKKSTFPSFTIRVK
jgi:hypothetical protein